jgi:hypothetical protein
MNEIIFIVSEPPEGGYAAEALGQSVFTVADTLEELNEMVRDAVICHFEEESRPKIIRLHFHPSGQESLPTNRHSARILAGARSLTLCRQRESKTSATILAVHLP